MTPTGTQSQIDFTPLEQALRPEKVFTIEDGVVRSGGRLIRPEDPDYDAARKIWNGMFDERRPAAVVQCSGVADVIAAVRFARREGLVVAPRCGGHSIPGFSTLDDGLVIDLSPMRGIEVDPANKRVRAQGGVLQGELDHECQAFGLATVGGQISNTGIAGLTLNGGWGWLSRRFGYAVDNMLSFQVVTADGALVTASPTQNPELFWALRGGGGNFGIVTMFEYRLYEVGPMVYGGHLSWPMEKARDFFDFYRAWAPTTPEELGTESILWYPLKDDGTPDDEPVISLSICYSGPVENGPEVIRAAREFAPTILDTVQELPYAVLQQQYDEELHHGTPTYYKYGVLPELSDELVELSIDDFLTAPSKLTFVTLGYWGAAMSRPTGEDIPFPRNPEPWRAVTETRWATAAEEDVNLAWAHANWGRVERFFSSRNQYLNFTGDRGVEMVRDAYGAETYERLREVKRTWDPDNFFRMNQNIVP